MKKKAVFLDRDGVLNQAVVKEGHPCPPASVSEVVILPGVAEGVQKLKDAGFVLIVVTNQPDVARGATSKAIVEGINGCLAKHMPIDRFIMCYHDTADGCDCRKPKPGMLIAGAMEFDVELVSSYMVGDRWRDVEAGRNAGCKTIFINYEYDEKQPTSFDYRVGSFIDAINIILKGNQE